MSECCIFNAGIYYENKIHDIPTNPVIFGWFSKSIFVIIPSLIKIRRTILSSLYGLYEKSVWIMLILDIKYIVV